MSAGGRAAGGRRGLCTALGTDRAGWDRGPRRGKGGSKNQETTVRTRVLCGETSKQHILRTLSYMDTHLDIEPCLQGENAYLIVLSDWSATDTVTKKQKMGSGRSLAGFGALV